MTLIDFQYRHCFVSSSGWFDNDEFVFITMEYFPLGDLEQYLDKPLPELQARQIAYQVLEAISFMHESGFVHRDLKPNVSNFPIPSR
jgi:serine/threonine protein kinase